MANKKLIEINTIETALLEEHSVDECVLQIRKTNDADQQIIAFVVSNGPFVPERLHTHLQAKLAAELLPSAYVPLSSLPLTADGQLDQVALARLPVIDTDLVQHWEQRIQSFPEIHQVAVVVQENDDVLPPLHLSSLVPNWQTALAASETSAIDIDNSVAVAPAKSTPTQLALSHGNPLREDSQAPTTLPAILQQAAREVSGKKIFYIQLDGSENVQSYADLLEQAKRISAGLRKQGLKPQDKVIFQLEHNQDIIPAFWGCLLGGFIPVIAVLPSSYGESSRSLEQLTQVWQLLEQPLIMTSAVLEKSMQTLSQTHPLKNARIVLIETLKNNKPNNSYYQAQPDEIAFFNLTSGSTGVPKCIMLTHRNILSRARGTNQLCQHSKDDIILNWLPFDHIGSISDWHLRGVELGCKLIYAPKEYVLAQPLNWLELIDKYRITHSWAPNFAYSLINDAIKSVYQKNWDLSCVKSLLTAGESISIKIVQNFLNNLAPYQLNKTAISTAFGMAEMGSGITYFQTTSTTPLKFFSVDRTALEGPLVHLSLDDPNRIIFMSLGPVIAGVSIRIVDDENNLLPEETIGHFQVKGAAVSPGYYKNPEANQVAFLADGWFYTGDLGFISEGHLVLTGRAKESIIINGANFYNSEIEAVVEEIEEVEVSYTAACAVRPTGNVTEQLAIFFHSPVFDDTGQLELIKKIQAQVTRKIGVKADYLIPVEKPAIPKTAIGKIQRSQLSQRFEAGEFDPIIKKLDIISGNDNTLPDWFYRTVWRRHEVGTKRPASQTVNRLIFLDNLGLGAQICADEKSSPTGGTVTVEVGADFAKLSSNRYRITPKQPAHYQQLLESLAQDNFQIDEILHLWTYGEYAGEVSSLESFEQAQVLGVYSLLYLLQALTKVQGTEHPVRLLTISSQTQIIAAGDEMAYEKTPLLGIIKTISQEIPWLSGRHIDLSIESTKANAALILRECKVISSEQEIAYRQGQRWVLRLESALTSKIPPNPLPFKKCGHYLINGGLEGIGVEVAKYLLQHFEARLLLIGQTPLPDENQWEIHLVQADAVAEKIHAYQTLRQAGGEIVYQAVDVSDFEQLQQLVKQTTSPLDGVIHLTGIPQQERLLIEETYDSLSASFRTEIWGVWTLHQLFKAQPNAIFINFASVADFFGGATIGAIAAASRFQDSLTRYQQQQTALQSYCFHWTLWENTAAKFPPQMAELSRALGYYTITANQGLHSFLAGLYHHQTPLLIGLEANNRHIRPFLETDADSTQKLTAYFSANTLVEKDKLLTLSVNDRFQTPSHCDFLQLHESVQFDPNAMELWPSVAEYFVYDELLYYALTHDERRNQSYKIAMNQLVKDKIVVEVGTGKEAILSRFCVEAGAKKVYAIEIGDDAYQEAVACVNNLGLSDKILLIHGDSTQVEIPELADVCVSEIVGPIGGCEGAALLMNDARRFLKPDGVMLPAKSVTKIVAMTFPDELWTDLGFNQVPGSYTEKIFAQIGHAFDLRLCIKKFPSSNILSNADIFEDLDFNHPIQVEHSHTIHLTINQEAELNGFLVWLNLHTVEGEVIDILEYEYSWLPVYLPVFHPSIKVSAGDTIQANCERLLCENGLNPDYHLKGRVIKKTGEVIEFEHNSYHHKQVFKQTPFFQKLFAQDEFGYNQKTRLDKLTQHFPEMPLTNSGAIDREKLVAFGQHDHQEAGTQVVPQNEVERQIADVWQDVLGIGAVGIHDNFFELGGHSLLLVQTQSQLQALFGPQLSLVEMFNYPTVHALAKHVGQTDTEPKSSQQGQARAHIRTNRQAAADNSDIAIVGMSCRFPGANTIDEFWKNMREGIESIHFFSDDDVAASGIDPTSADAPHYVKASPLLDNVEWFDAEFFGYTAREAELLDPQHRLFLECAWEAMESAGYDSQTYQGSIGLYAGASMNTYLLNHVYPNRNSLDSNDNLEVATLDSLGGFQLMVANDKDYLPTRTSYKLNLKGPSINVQTACSTTLVTVHMACQSLQSGECDMVLSGGSSVQIPQKAGHLFQEGMIVSPDGHCRAFDAKAQGTVFGSGVGVVVLKRLTDAMADGDHIYAVIKGSAVNNDGLMKVGYMAPSSEGQAAVASEALAMSGVSASTIQYVEAHGTGTEMGDPIEVSGLTQAFRASTDNNEFCAIGSVKTNVGHLQIASGVVGFMKTVLALYHKQIPPSLHFENPNPQIDFANSPFYVNTKLRDFQNNGIPCRAGVNSLGIGGTNAHAVLEEAPVTAPINNEIERPKHLLTLSAKNEQALQDLVQRYDTFLSSHPETSLAEICFTANTGRVHFEHRIAIVADDKKQLRTRLLDLKETTSKSHIQNIAFLFTGQGAQYVGMGRQLYETQPTFRKTLDRCNEILRDYLEQPLLEVIYSSLDDQSKLDETAYTQPALFALEYALAELWLSWGIKPFCVMGHSVGEYVAACVAGVFSLEDGLKLIVERARLMQALPRDGEMVTVFASEAQVATAIQRYTKHVSIAAINGPESIVISGQREAIATITANLKVKGVKTKPLSVSHAFHSPLIEPMLPAFSQIVGEVTLSSPEINFISNLTGELATAEITTPAYWCRHVTHPVKFAASMATLHRQDCDVFVEIGPRPVSLGMGRQCLPQDVGIWLPSLRQGEDDWQQLLQSLGELYVRGASIDWSGFDRDYQRRRVALPTYPFQRQRYWLDRPTARREMTAPTENKTKLHPLLDKQIPLPLLKETVFETYFHKDTHPFLLDHIVYDQIVASAASYISMLLGVTELTFHTKGCILEEIIFQQAMIIPEEEGCAVQLTMVPENEAESSFKIISLDKNAAESAYHTHVTGKILTTKIPNAQSSLPNIQELWAQCQSEMAAEEFYDIQRLRQIFLGPNYQWISAIRQGNGETIARITTPSFLSELEEYQLHPGLIDAGLQLLLSMVDKEIEETFFPFRIERVCFYQRPNSIDLWGYCQLRPNSDEEMLAGDIRLFDEAGQVIIEIFNFEGRKANRNMRRAITQSAPLQNWLYQVEWQPKFEVETSRDSTSKANEHWLIFSDDQGVGLQLGQYIEDKGGNYTRVLLNTAEESAEEQTLRIDHTNPNSFQQVLETVTTKPGYLRGIIYGWSLDTIATNNLTVEDLESTQRLVCGSLLYLVQALEKINFPEPPALWLVTQGAMPVTLSNSDAKAQPILNIVQSPLWGMGKVIALEHPELNCVQIDLDPDTKENQAAQILLQEIFGSKSQENLKENQIAFRGETRYVARLVRYRSPIREEVLAFRADSTYLITGGLGGLGLLVAHWMVEQGAKYLVLVGRSGKAADNQQLEALEQTGTKIRVAQADVAQSEQMAQVLADIEQSWPPLRGIIHAAGILDDGVLMNQTWERFSKALAPKVQGAWNLHSLSLSLSLDFFVLFSSVASLVGSNGQANYTAANMFLDALAFYRQTQGLPGLSINWGTWSEIGIAAQRQADERFRQKGITPIDPKQGLQILEQLFLTQSSQAQVGVVPIDWSMFIQQAVQPFLSDLVPKKQPLDESQQETSFIKIVNQLQTASQEERLNMLIDYLQAQFAKYLGSSRPDIQQPLNNLGLDSLMAVELRNTIRTQLSVELTLGTFLTGATISELATEMESQLTAIVQNQTDLSQENVNSEWVEGDI